MAATTRPASTCRHQHSRHSSNSNHGNIGRRQAQSDVRIQDVDDVQLVTRSSDLLCNFLQPASTRPTSNVQPSREQLTSNRQTSDNHCDAPTDNDHYDLPADNDHYDLPADNDHYDLLSDNDHYDLPSDNDHYDLPTEYSRTSIDPSQHYTVNDSNDPSNQSTECSHQPVEDSRRNQGRTALSMPPASRRPALLTPLSKSDTVSSPKIACHVLHAVRREHEEISSARDETLHENVDSNADADSTAEYAEVGQADEYEDINEIEIRNNQQFHLPQRAATNTLIENRRRVIIGIVAGVLIILVVVITVTIAVVTNHHGRKRDQSQAQSSNFWSAVTPKPLCHDSMRLSIRYKSHLTLPQPVSGSDIQFLSVFGNGTVMVSPYVGNTLYLYEVEGSITYSCTVKCEVYQKNIAIWTPRGDIMCLNRDGNIAVVRINGLVNPSNANKDFEKACSSKLIRSAVIRTEILSVEHASVCLQGVPAIFVISLFNGVYQSTDEGVTWRHILLKSHVSSSQSHTFHYVFGASTENQTYKLLTLEQDIDGQYLRLAAVNNGSLVLNLTRPLKTAVAVGGAAYNYPSHILYSVMLNLSIHVMSVNGKLNYCQLELIDSAGPFPRSPSPANIFSLLVNNVQGSNSTTLYVGLDYGRVFEYALLGGS